MLKADKGELDLKKYKQIFLLHLHGRNCFFMRIELF
jgi:hypothetical protein